MENENKKLKLGKMKTKELAEWMGISSPTFTHCKEQKFKILEKYCDFEQVYGGAIIKEIYNDIYSPDVDDDKFYLQKVLEAKDHLASISGITELALREKEYEDLSYYQVEKRMKRAGERCFGVTKDLTSEGKYGRREYVWCIKLYGRPNRYRYMTKEEDEIFDELIDNLYKAMPRQNKRKKILLEQLNRKNTEMSAAEYIQKQNELSKGYNFADVIRIFRERTGQQIVHATRHDIEESMREDGLIDAGFSFENSPYAFK